MRRGIACLGLVLASCSDHERDDRHGPPAPAAPPPATAVARSEPAAVVPAVAPREPACPAGEVYIPATGPGGFVMGRGYLGERSGDDPERVGRGHRAGSDHPHRVVLTRAFCIDAREVSVADWVECVDRGACAAPPVCHRFHTWPDQRDRPINCVDWRDAKRFCESRGKSLPTEAQWEWAATGGDGRRFPWGDDEPTCDRADFVPGVLPNPAPDAGCNGGGPSAVGSHPSGAKRWPGGDVQDLAGNVWEWCLDNYLPYRGADETDPLHLPAADQNHVVRGGGWNRSGYGIRAGFRGGAPVDYRVPGLGLRCVRSLG